jgi:hypothetical protein
VIGAGGGDRCPGVALRMTVLSRFGGLEGGEVRCARGIVGLALDIRPKLGGKLAFAGRKHRGLVIERVTLPAH